MDDVDKLEEILKWGELAYLAKKGSTNRITGSKSNPEQYAMFANCKTTLIATFREIYGNRFRFEGNRAIVFSLDDELPVEKLKHCIAIALTYHMRKHRPLPAA